MDRAAAHAFVADLEAPTLSAEDHHHLWRVLRLAPGTRVTVGDGAGAWRLATLRGADRHVDPVGDVVVEVRPTPPIGVAFALTKGERPEWTVQKLTELGVDRIIAVAAARSVVRLDDERAARAAERWRRVAREAAMQCRRAWLPAVEGVITFANLAAASGRTLALAHPGGEPPSLARPLVAVGPEGGWDPAELALAAPATFVGLGDLVLRAETASLAVATLLVAMRQGTVPSPSPRTPGSHA